MPKYKHFKINLAILVNHLILSIFTALINTYNNEHQLENSERIRRHYL